MFETHLKGCQHSTQNMTKLQYLDNKPDGKTQSGNVLGSKCSKKTKTMF